MKTRILHWLFSIALLFGLAPLARGATPTIVGPDTVCRGGSVVYKAKDSAGIIYNWTVTAQGAVTSTTVYGDSSLATILWSNAGTATITLYGIDPTTGDTVFTATKTVVVYAPPDLYLTSDVTIACSQYLDHDPPPDSLGCYKYCNGSTVTYTLHGDTSGTSTWTVTGGTISFFSAGTCVVDWDPAMGSGSLSVTETMPWGCVTTITICITLVQPPKAKFQADTAVCDSAIAHFIDQSVGDPNSPIISWYWNFGDGFTSGAPGGPLVVIDHQYVTPGTYTATLTVTNACGCSSTYSWDITVMDSTGVKIECPSVVCENDTATYSVDASCGTYDWNVIGGTIVSTMPYTNTIRVVWDNPSAQGGNGLVSFIPDTSCHLPCPQPTRVIVPIVQQTGNIQGQLITCPNTQYIYTLPQWPTTEYNWYVESVSGTASITHTDQANQIALTTGTGPDVIQLKCNYHNTLLGCGGVAAIRIRVLPASAISVQPIACLGGTVGGEITPFPTATANWTITAPDNTQTFSAGHTFTFTAAQVGTYMIQAVSPTSSYCPPDAVFVTVDTVQRADSIVGPDTICVGEPALFTGMNPIPNTVFHWQVVGGTPNAEYGNSTYVTFSGPGPYIVRLWRETVYGFPYCQSVIIQKQVYPPHVVLDIQGQDSVCGSSYENYHTDYLTGETYNWTIVPATAGSVSPVNGSPAVTVLWNNPPPAGQSAWLILKMRKCATTYLDSFKVFVRGNPSFTIIDSPNVDTICAGYLLTVGLSPTGPATTTWDFGDGYVTTGATASHAYATFNSMSPVSYTITATVTNAYGCLGTYVFTRDIWVKPAPVPFITPVGPFLYCDDLPDDVTLTADAESGYGGPITTYVWNGCPTCPFTGTNTYNVNDLGYISCTETNSVGCSATTNVVAFYNHCDSPTCNAIDPPTGISVSDVVSACGEITFTGSTSGGTVTSVEWTAPGATSISPTVSGVATATYPAPGVFTGFFNVLTPNGTPPPDDCLIQAHISDTIPYIVGLLYTITCDTSNPGNYLVTLFDHSSYYPVTPISFYDFTITGPTSGSQSGPLTSYSLSVAPGSYTFGLTIGDGTHLNCGTSVNVSLPALPTASFTYAFDSACAVDTSVHFTNTSVGATSYSWDFGDATHNYETNPYHVYSSSGIDTVKLYVSNDYGCRDTVAQTIFIHVHDLIGSLTMAPAYACDGDPITISYNPGLGSYPDYYNWIFDGDPFAYTTTPSVNVYEPGAYWLNGTSHYGCRVVTGKVFPDITEVPDAVIYGEQDQCVNVSFTLSGYVGFTTAYVYGWIIDGTPYPGSPELTQLFNVAGVHTYQVIVRVNGAHGPCFDTSDVFTVTVHDLPAPPMVTVSVIDCPTYTLQLDAVDADDPGYYNWSNGDVGASINVNQGGPYKVTFTDNFGCRNSSYITVPRDPKAYMWTFPTGCFTFCSDFMPRTLVGPIIQFNYWAWLMNQTVDLDGSYSVPSPYTVNAAGTYNFILNNGLCSDTSGDMSLTVDSNCECPTKRWVTIDSVYKDSTEDHCWDFVVIQFTGGFATSIGWAASAHHGTLLPYSGTEPAFYAGTETLRYIADPGFTGPVDTIVITITYNGKTCITLLPIEIEPCDNSYAPKEWNGGDSLVRGVNKVTMKSSLAQMTIIPNPAQNDTRVDYTFSEAGGNRYLEMYDMTGRLMDKMMVTENKGSWNLDLNRYAAGMYVVIVRQDGRVLLQSKLSIVR
ncbi:MAG: hypothetical protein BGO69_11865 [Bacteroidetes bacterium 46-16]|jgi:PKD repeat protein|nr:MAG: hypothetical protein BGO69_11865 [Bacteroidetes bacterium 46-16]